ncbi:MAG: DUF503 domain-containing protein [Bacillota bacterium]
MGRAFVGLAEIELVVAGSTSLKDKRRVIRSCLERVRRIFGISAAEVGDQNHRDRAVLALACVSGEAATARRIIDEAVRAVEANPELIIHDVSTNII